MSFLLYLAIPIIGALYYMEVPRITINKLKDLHRRFKRLTGVVSHVNKNNCRVICISLWIIVKAMYILLLQKLNKSVKKLDDNTFEVHYVLYGRLHKMLVHPVKGPSPIFLIMDENDDDVTDTILPYLGPEHNFHRNDTLTPNNFGFKSLTFEYDDGTSEKFCENDIIKMKQK